MEDSHGGLAALKPADAVHGKSDDHIGPGTFDLIDDSLLDLPRVHLLEPTIGQVKDRHTAQIKHLRSSLISS